MLQYSRVSGLTITGELQVRPYAVGSWFGWVKCDVGARGYLRGFDYGEILGVGSSVIFFEICGYIFLWVGDALFLSPGSVLGYVIAISQVDIQAGGAIFNRTKAG